jgi:hypothetical protein
MTHRPQPSPVQPIPIELDFTKIGGEIVWLRAGVYLHCFTRRVVIEVTDCAGLPYELVAGALCSALKDGRCKASDEVTIAISDGWPVMDAEARRKLERLAREGAST